MSSVIARVGHQVFFGDEHVANFRVSVDVPFGLLRFVSPIPNRAPSISDRVSFSPEKLMEYTISAAIRRGDLVVWDLNCDKDHVQEVVHRNEYLTLAGAYMAEADKIVDACDTLIGLVSGIYSENELRSIREYYHQIAEYQREDSLPPLSAVAP